MEIKRFSGLDQISREAWNALISDGYPFLRYEFLIALEQSGCVAENTGWQPKHILLYDDDELIAALPLYQKAHSWGEFVFDSQWAQAAQHYGQKYYPKFLTAIPFTPCQGPRILVKNGYNEIALIQKMFHYIKEVMKEEGILSWHCLFPEQKLLEVLKTEGLIIREGVQFHWFNKGYSCFDDFLASLTASKRKMVKRERRKVTEQGIELIQISGSKVTDVEWHKFYDFYRMTYFKRGMTPYLNLDFFQTCAATMGEKILMVFAIKQTQYVGAALSFIGVDTLYGRYWGCLEDFDSLHFEACYYQGLDYCIENRLQHFDSGAQGEHKIVRGFEPVTTYSAHWFHDVQFAEAIGRFVVREKKSIEMYKEDAANYLPFKK